MDAHVIPVVLNHLEKEIAFGLLQIRLLLRLKASDAYLELIYPYEHHSDVLKIHQRCPIIVLQDIRSEYKVGEECLLLKGLLGNLLKQQYEILLHLAQRFDKSKAGCVIKLHNKGGHFARELQGIQETKKTGRGKTQEGLCQWRQLLLMLRCLVMVLVMIELVDKCKTGLGYNVVPPLYTGNFMPPKPNLSFSGLEEFVNEPIVSEPTILLWVLIVDGDAQRKNGNCHTAGGSSSGPHLLKTAKQQSCQRNQECLISMGCSNQGLEENDENQEDAEDLLKEDINQKFLRSLPPSWSQIALIMRNKPGIDQTDIDDLYNNLRITAANNEVSPASGNFGVNTTGGTSSSSQVSSTLGFAQIDQMELEGIRYLDGRSSDEEITQQHDRFSKADGVSCCSPSYNSISITQDDDISFASFKNHAMNEFCAKKGIKREFSVARTPQQNGIVERKNRTLIEAARTMLADSLLPIPFWAEAVNTAC
ncbi:putative ribonuclease H-like domain-containing protein [Tanacetum coccineum]